jgi:hypothetical protein
MGSLPLTRRSSSHSSHSALRIRQTTGQPSLSIETISRLGSNNTNGLTLSTSTYTIERQSPRDVSSSEPHITGGEDVGLCYPSEGRRGATLNLPHPARHLIPRTARSHIYVHKGERLWIKFCYWEAMRKLHDLQVPLGFQGLVNQA